MRLVRLLALFLTMVAVSVSVAPSALAEPPLRLPGYVTDNAGVLDAGGRSQVSSAIDALYESRKTRLWVVYVESFSGQAAETWARNTMRASDLGDFDALLAVATVDRAYAFLVPDSATELSSSRVEDIRRNEIEPALRQNNWAGAAVAAANGLDQSAASAAGFTWVCW
jgi:uncharacterized membrane protein YgcG